MRRESQEQSDRPLAQIRYPGRDSRASSCTSPSRPTIELQPRPLPPRLQQLDGVARILGRSCVSSDACSPPPKLLSGCSTRLRLADRSPSEAATHSTIPARDPQPPRCKCCTSLRDLEPHHLP